MPTGEIKGKNLCEMCWKPQDIQKACLQLDCPLREFHDMDVSKAAHNTNFYENPTDPVTPPAPQPRTQPLPSAKIAQRPGLRPRSQSNIKLKWMITILVSFLIGGCTFAWFIPNLPNYLHTSLLQPPPTATPFPTSGTVLYNANWSNGLNGWEGSSDWKVGGGILRNDGTNSSEQAAPTIVAPYQVQNISNYAVEVKIKVVSGETCFDAATIRGSSTGSLWWAEWNGYKATICPGDTNGEAEIKAGDQVIAQTGFDPGNNTEHTYQLEAIGTQIKLLIDGVSILEVEDNHYLSGGEVGLKSLNTELDVSSFKVIAL